MSQTTNERWLPVVGYEEYYEVSDHGRVRSIDRRITAKDGSKRFCKGVELRPWTMPSGHQQVSLVRNGKGHSTRVHVLVMLAFRGPRPEGKVVCHNDSNPKNNHLSNLRWDTQAENIWDTVRAGRHGGSSKTHCPKGHEYTDENTYRCKSHPNGRYCRTCIRERNERAKEARASAGRGGN